MPPRATEGYATLLGLVFAELAHDLPGLFGDVGLTRLFPLPARTLRDLVEALNDPALDSAWSDDTTLGWVYQYWNDPERERLDAKINDGQKIEPHEIASKTQMFTERYMVEWLLQNSLGLTWLAMCKKHGWRPDADDVLGALDARRAEWRTKREAGEVALDARMPIHGPLEDRWKYWVPQPIPDDAVEKAPDSIRGLKLLDPACGSGHFLVIAFDLLAALYEEEARRWAAGPDRSVRVRHGCTWRWGSSRSERADRRERRHLITHERAVPQAPFGREAPARDRSCLATHAHVRVGRSDLHGVVDPGHLARGLRRLATGTSPRAFVTRWTFGVAHAAAAASGVTAGLRLPAQRGTSKRPSASCTSAPSTEGGRARRGLRRADRSRDARARREIERVERERDPLDRTGWTSPPSRWLAPSPP